ncbi:MULTISPECIES: hypothetical protein [Oscillatoriophycideae]|uniref:Uncharacterized protein n=1 Tax=Aerosakkonema funiforme FACHB-1375 TaxID=2949571 RepID=A0A926VJJ7_9CYAN|nr:MULTISPECIES: hypothetical protein [Oscillatoriales]MBD2184843.1 hypothetical protein [Aerosakkonema funiforme FACHB-1375]MBD3559835.1 hypothetical protein [Planktothrix sp. FACHB-1355]
MARYTSSYTVSLPLDRLKQLLIEVLKSCSLDILYETIDYIMAREKPGQVGFAKLVTVEVLIDRSTATATQTKMSLVMKNEELPLQVDNHCHQIFDRVSEAIVSNRQWQIIENVAGELPTI